MALDADALKRRVTGSVRSFSPSQLAVIALLGVVALVAMLTFFKWASTPSYSVLFADLEPKDASAIVGDLKGKGVPYKLGADGTAVLVPSSRVHEVRMELSAGGLPKGGVVGYEILDKQSLTTSDFQQRVDYQRALEGELTRTLLSLDGVEAASVHLVLPEQRLFADDSEADARASVLLDTTQELGEDAVQSVVHLVASSVPGLSPEKVTVADVGGRVLSGSGTSSGTESNRQLRLAKQYETQLASDVSAMLAQAFGPGHAIVRVSAQLNFDERERETETYDRESATVLREQTTTESYQGQGAPPGGTLGVDASTAGTTQEGSDYERNETSREFGVDRVVERSKVAPGTVERLSAAVVLDSSTKPVPDAEKVEAIVSSALGLDAERGDSITVETVAFDRSLTKQADAARAKQESKESQQQLLGYARTGVGALVLLLVAFFLIRGLKPRVEQLDVAPQPVGELLAATTGAAGALAPPIPASLPAGTGAADSQVLQLIDQQPEAVATLLRSWLADRRT